MSSNVMKKVALYENTLGQALRGAGRREFGSRFDTFPLVVVAEVPERIAKDLGKGGQLLQRVLPPLSLAVQAIVRDHLAPKLSPNEPSDEKLKGTIDQVLKDRAADLNKPVSAEIEKHYTKIGEWHKLRNSNLKEGGIITVTLSFSAAALAITPWTGGISGAAGVIGLARGIIDGLEKLVTCGNTAEEWRARVNNDIRLLNSAYDKSPDLGRAVQIGGGISRNSGIGKAITVATGAFGRGRDLTPSIASIDSSLGIYRGKIAHLYTFLDKMTLRLIELLDQQDKLTGSPLAIEKVTKSVSALLGGEGTRRGQLSGFRGRYTIPDAMSKCEAGIKYADECKKRLDELRAKDKYAGLTATAVKAAEVTTNLGLTAINYPGMFHQPGSPTDAFGFGDNNTAPALGMFNDAVGALQELVGIYKDLSSDKDEAKEREVKLSFTELPGAPPPIKRARSLADV